MRQVYSSPRQGNIDLVVRLFTEHGIESHISDMPAHRRNDYTTRFSYRDTNTSHWPKVWVVHAEDLPRARELLRSAGVEPTIRHAEDLARARQRQTSPLARRRRIGTLVRFVLLAIIVILVAATIWRRWMG